MNSLEQLFPQTQDTLSQIQNLLQQLQQFGSLEALNKQLTLEEQARVSAALSFSLNSLYFAYMRTNGISLENHKIMPELERIKQYFTKIQAQNKPPAPAAKKVQLDIESSKRLIQGHLQEEQEECRDLWADKGLKKNKQSQRIHKGALLPKTTHLNWREQLDKLKK